MGARTLLDKIIQDAETGERSPRRALARPRLRPYLPGKTTLRTLAAGSKVLCGYALKGLRRAVVAVFTEQAQKPAVKEEKHSPEDGKGVAGKEKDAEKKTPTAKATPKADWLERAAIGLLGTLVGAIVIGTAVATVGPQLQPYLPIAASVATLGWVIAAWIVAPEKPRKKPKKSTPAEEPRHPPVEPLPDTPEGRQLAFLRWLEKTTRGVAGIHLDQMHRQLAEQDFGKDFPRHYLRPLLDHYGIAVQRTLRVGPVAGRTGVTRQAVVDALTAASAAPPPGMESGSVEPLESDSDLRGSTDSTGPLRPVEHPVPGGA